MDKETIVLQKEILKMFWKDVEMIPVFINTENIIHNKCRMVAKEAITNICFIMEPSILKRRFIDKLFLTFTDYIEEIIDLDGTIGLLYYGYFNELFEYYREECLECELYESAENITKFLDNFDKKIKNEDE
jgi:hypothetical protein